PTGRFLEPGGAGYRGTGNQGGEKRKICAAAVFRRFARPLHVFPGRGLAETPRRIYGGFEALRNVALVAVPRKQRLKACSSWPSPHGCNFLAMKMYYNLNH